MKDKTMEAAKWLYDANRDFRGLKTDESWRHLQSVMVMAKLYFLANGPEYMIPGPIAVKDGRAYLPGLEARRRELHGAKPDFQGDELKALKIILRRFAYATPGGLARGLMEAEPMSRYAHSLEETVISEDEIPADLMLSMAAVKKQFENYDFNYRVIQVSGRNFIADPDFELRRGDYDELVRGMNEGLLEPDVLYRLSRDAEGNLYAW